MDEVSGLAFGAAAIVMAALGAHERGRAVERRAVVEILLDNQRYLRREVALARGVAPPPEPPPSEPQSNTFRLPWPAPRHADEAA